MAPWTRHLLETQIEKVTVHNYEDIARRIVGLLDTRSTVQRMAAMVVRQTNRWYMPTFHQQLDAEKRNLCDNFVASLVHAMALRTKPIRDVPTPEGLSGIPLLKADLLSVFIYRRMSIGPIATALYNSGNLTVDDLIVVIRACLDASYTTKLSHLGDALLLFEHGGRQLDAAEPQVFMQLFAKVKGLLDAHADRACERRKAGDRMVPSLYDRYHAIRERRDEGWRISPYGLNTQSAVESNDKQHGNDHGRLVRSTTNDSSATDDADSSPPHTPTSEQQQQQDAITTVEEPSCDTFWGASTVDSHDHRTHIASPWNAYFAPRPAKARSSNGSILEKSVKRSDTATTIGTPSQRIRRPSLPPQGQRDDGSVRMEILPRGLPSDLMLCRESLDRVSLSEDRACQPGRSEALSQLLSPSGNSKSARQRTQSDGHTNKGKPRHLPPLIPKPTLAAQSQDPCKTVDGTVRSHRSQVREADRSRAHVGKQRTHSTASRNGSINGVSSKLFPATFDGDATWIQLDQPLPTPIRIRFPSDFLIGDAQRVARLFARALAEQQDQVPQATSVAPDHVNGALHFTPSGAVVQDFTFGSQTVYVEYPPEMTLARARDAGHRLASMAAHLAV